TNNSTKSWNKKINPNNILDTRVSRLLTPQTDVDLIQLSNHLKQMLPRNLLKPVSTSTYVNTIINSFDSSISKIYLKNIYNELRRKASRKKGYEQRKKEVRAFIKQILTNLQLKYEKLLSRTKPFCYKKYSIFLHIITHPKIMHILELTIPKLAKTKISFRYNPLRDTRYDEAILYELLSQAYAIIQARYHDWIRVEKDE
ncbi:hypothetical protein PMALA_074850, partial [Plasmodium malariae]